MKRHVDFPVFVSVWNDLQGLETPDLHIRICRWLERCGQTGDRKLLLMAFRNSGKSTLIGLLSAWLLMRNPDLRILVIAADFALAGKMVRNVKRIIERHPLTTGLKPACADQWASGQFSIIRSKELRDPSMLAKGIGANVTGSRADVLIYDDVEVPNTCDSTTKRADLRERLVETEYVLVPGGLQLFVGTPHTYYTIYADKPRRESGEDKAFLDGFGRLELPVLDERGESRWPERFPMEKVESIKRRTGPNKFESQMMLRPVSLAEGRLNPDLIRLYDHDLVYAEGNKEAMLSLNGKRLVSASCWWDPSYGSPRKGDASVIAAVFTDDGGDYWLHRVSYLEHDPALNDRVDEATQLCRKVVNFVKSLYLPAVNIETNGLGKFLPGLLRRELALSGIACAVVETASHRNKDLRIIDAFDAVLAAGRLHAHGSVWDSRFIAEMREWQAGSNGPDDGLDAVSGCLLNQPVRLSRRPALSQKEIKARRNWRPGDGGFIADSEFNI